MAKSKNTRHALLASVLSLMLCAAMLIGTTFAWFTDSVTSGNNTIVAGNLDVELYYGENLDKKVDDATDLFKVDAWEPGVVAYENLKVVNNGSLALTYKLSVNVVDFNTVIDAENVDTGKSLKDVLKVAVVENGFNGNRESVQALNFDKTLTEFIEEGTLLAKDESRTYGLVIYWEPTAADNDYNLSNGKKASKDDALFVELGIGLVATQTPYESDSFNENYDADAVYPPVTDWYDPDDTSVTRYSIGTAEELAGLAELVNEGTSFKGKTIALKNDINLQNKKWTPIGTKANPFNGTLDGGNNTISNINAQTNADGYTGLFGKLDGASISNITLDGVTANSSKNDVGAVAGTVGGNVKLQNVAVENANVKGKNNVGGLLGNSFTATITDCTVKNSTITGVEYVGGITGTSYAKMSGLTVEDCQIISTSWKVGGIVGQLNEGSFTLNDLTVKNTVVQGASNCVGGIVGFSNYGSKTFNNCNVIDCTLQLDPAKTTGTFTGVSGMIGQIYSQNGNVFNFNDCKVLGLKLSAGKQKMSGAGAYFGNGYWRGFAGTTFNFNGCTADIAEVTSSQSTSIGAFGGDAKNNTYNFTGVNTISGIINDVFGQKGANIVIIGEDTIIMPA